MRETSGELRPVTSRRGVHPTSFPDILAQHPLFLCQLPRHRMKKRPVYNNAERVKVAPGVAGLGVFAVRKFRKGQTVGEVTGKIHLSSGHESRYCMDLGHDRVLEPGEPFRYMNHSCDPNVQIFYWYDEDHPDVQADSLYVQALRTIQPGEELFIDYAWPAWFAIPCLCQAKNCRGWIVDPTEQHLVEKEQAKAQRAAQKKKVAKKQAAKNARKRAGSKRKGG